MGDSGGEKNTINKTNKWIHGCNWSYIITILGKPKVKASLKVYILQSEKESVLKPRVS